MPNETYRKKIVRMINSAIKEVENSGEVEHSGLEGKIVEIAISNIFIHLLPDGYKVGSGKICDSEGTLSKETDLVIYNKSFLPPLMFTTQSEKDGFFPIESCYYSIEVKRTINASRIKDAIDKSNEILKLKPKFQKTKYQQIAIDGRHIVTALFAFNSDITTKDELERYKEHDLKWNTDPAVEAICIVGKGYWHFNEFHKKWAFRGSTESYDEIINFVGYMVNNLAFSKEQYRPALFTEYIENIEKKDKTI